MGKLTALKVKSLKDPGRYTDGDGLMLVIGADGSRKWVLRVQAAGKRRDIGLGRVADVELARARELAGEFRKAIRDGRDPVAERRAAKVAAEAEPMPTFREAAISVHGEHKPSWKNAKHAAQWLSTLEQYVFPRFGNLPVDEVTGPMVRDALAEIWLTIPETARRVRQHIGTVLDWAHAKGYRPSEAPIRAVSRGLPKQPRADSHFAALGWEQVPSFIETLRGTDKAGETVKLALEFLILTAVRSGEMRGARWNEIDQDAATWTIPAERMKAGRAHVVPLSSSVLQILSRTGEMRVTKKPEALVFPGRKQDRPMSDMTLTMLLRRIAPGLTAHGFRSTFRDWAAEQTGFPREVAEAALAHAIESKVEAAYRRSDLLEKRRKLMAAWADYCAGGARLKVVRMKGAAR